MKLLFIYGPPAVGKLTIAEKVSKKTGIRLFHNHMTRDLVEDLYGPALNEHYGLVDSLRTKIFEYCAQQGTDIIFTYVYGGAEDDQGVQSYIDIVESNGGEVVFVELVAHADDLLARVDNESRKQFKKLTNPEKMQSILQDGAFISIPFVDSLQLNTSEMNPNEASDIITKHITKVS